MIFFLIISKISISSSILTFSSNLCLNSSLNKFGIEKENNKYYLSQEKKLENKKRNNKQNLGMFNTNNIDSNNKYNNIKHHTIKVTSESIKNEEEKNPAGRNYSWKDLQIQRTYTLFRQYQKLLTVLTTLTFILYRI